MKEILFTYSWTSMVFENRNQAYGAFMLRKLYEKHLIVAFLMSMSFVSLFIIGIYCAQLSQNAIINSLPLIEERSDRVIEILGNPFERKSEIVTAKSASSIKKSNRPIVVADQETVEEEQNTASEIVSADIGGNLEGSSAGGNASGTEAPVIIQELPPALPEVFLVADTMPYFHDLQKYLSRHINYPKRAANSGIEGKVFIQFVIDEKGSMSQLKVIKPLGFGCEEESIRVLSQMPPWKPGKSGNRAVKVRLTIPINFKLN